MAIFPDLVSDKLVAVGDRLRLDATNSIKTPDEAAITLVEIDPDGSGFVDVTGNSSKDWYLDWEYSTDAGSPYSATVRITTDGAPVTKSLSIAVISEADDKLFSDDQDLKDLETDIIKYLPKGRNSFKYAHREAQNQILQYLYKVGIFDVQGNKLTKDAIIDVEEVRFWSKYLAHKLIHMDLSTIPGDQFDVLSQKYSAEMNYWRHASRVKLDLNGDGSIDSEEGVDITWRRLDRA